MIGCIAAILALAALWWLCMPVRLPGGTTPAGWQRAFCKTAYFLLYKIKKRLHKGPVTAFETERLSGVLTVCFLGACAALLLQAAMLGRHFLIDGYKLNRPGEDQGDYVQELQARFADNDQTEQMEITVSRRQYTKEEQEAFLDRAEEELPAAILGENPSNDEVRGRVNLPQKAADGQVTIEWTQEPYGLLDDEGNIKEGLPDEGALLQLTATLACGGQQRIYECALRLLPPVYSEEEKLRRALESEVEKADRDSAQENALPLPTQVQGRRIIWQEKQTSVTGLCLTLTALAAVCVWIGKDREFQKKQELRRRQMILDYPDFLFKLSMLLNAGMTMQNAFSKMAFAYRDRGEGKVRYVYEEMLTACYEMKRGVPEARAYENFGRRCGIGAYNKLGMMLSSNLQKGSEGLAKLLQEMASSAMEERRQMARKLGEEAGTKLLAPMMMMLLVVLAVLMVPAMMAF